MRKHARIAVDARSLLCAQPRGEGKSLLRLYEEIVRQDASVEVVLFGDEHADAYRGNLPERTRTVRMPSLTHRWDVWEDILLPLEAKRHGCSLIHGASSSTPRWPSMPTMMTVHDLIPIVFDDGHTHAERQRFARRLRRSVATADTIVAVSGSTRADIERTIGPMRTAVDVIHWGGDCTHEGPSRPGSPPTVLMFGGAAPRKNTLFGLERFIDAAAMVPDLHLVIVGVPATPFRAALEDRLRIARLEHRVRMPGFVDEQQLASILTNAVALMYLSRYEGFGLPVLEAIGSGVPVIASDCAALAEVLQGVPGSLPLADPAGISNELARIAREPGARDAMIRAQQTVMARFRWADAASRYLQRMRKISL